MKLNDRLIGLIAILGGIAIIAGTLGFREAPGQQFGSAFFPRIVGGAAILVGIVQMAVAAPGPPIRIAPELRSADAFCKLAVLVLVVFWLLAVQSLGFLLTTSLVVLLLALVLGARPLPALLTAAGIPVLLHAIFALLLRVPLPRGVLEAWLT
ncbi:tripartite tricarboxylate transporter TctB family protein [Tropicimonas sp.]|uniref:tripartite tricarboxylate transporter TctB family protein n=1 Tax=Tropicimonas sp. TaxID=2067044 RepID=UPI003A8B3D2F